MLGVSELILVFSAITIAHAVLWAVVTYRMHKTIDQLSKMLASRNFSEYSVGEARLTGTRPEQKDTVGYDSVWNEEN